MGALEFHARRVRDDPKLEVALGPLALATPMRGAQPVFLEQGLVLPDQSRIVGAELYALLDEGFASVCGQNHRLIPGCRVRALVGVVELNVPNLFDHAMSSHRVFAF